MSELAMPAVLNASVRHRLGLLLVTGSAIAWSTAGFFTRLIDLDSATMLVWRGLFGGLGILAFVAWRERKATLESFRTMTRPSLLFVAVSMIGMVAFIASFRFTTVAHVAIVYATVPFIAAAMAWLVLGERPQRSAVMAGLGALAGVAIMVGRSGEGNLLGDLLAFAMTLAMAAMMVIARRGRGIAVAQAACLSCLLSALVCLPFAGSLWVSGPNLAYLALFGLVNSAIGIVLFTLGSRLLPAIETALIGSLDAPLAPIWVWLFFAETPSWATLAGGLVVFAAVFAHVLVSARGL